MRIGLTGGIASGKSTVSAIFREAGALIIDADRIAHDLLKKGSPAYAPVLDFFGASILGASGEIDRKALGQMVFQSEAKRRALNQIVHPWVFERAEQERAQRVSAHPQAVIIFDVPLLIETGAHLKMDMLILVYVDPPTQIERLIERDRCSRREAEERIRAQMPLEEKRRWANEVIDSRRSVEEVRNATLDIYRCLRRTLE